MKAFSIIVVVVSCAVFYVLENELHDLRRENHKLKTAYSNERFRFETVERQLDMYQLAFSRAENTCPQLSEQFDLLVNGIDPWQNKKSNLRNSNSSEKTTPASKQSSGTKRLIPTGPSR